MRILFIENRYKTFFYESIAKELAKTGFEIHFLIQNKEFELNQSISCYTIPYPKVFKSAYKKIDEVEAIIESDRQQNHFNKTSKDYFYYYHEEIDKILDTIKPDFVFGESTAFHELLTITLCKKKAILYLNPSSCRYPIGRFSFYKYDTLEPYSGSGEKLSNTVALKTIEGIINRTAKPDYMMAHKTSVKARLKDKLKLIRGYMKGERYNTPNPLIKNKLEKEKIKNIEKWDALAKENNRENSQFRVLYPLQMQPEANIDVWGKKYRHQTKLITEIIENLPSNAILFVKPNPKSKYELTSELIELVGKSQNCIAIDHSIKMDAIINDIDLVITVTGTIAIECILNNKPVITMVKTLNNKAPNCIYLEFLKDDLKTVIEKVKNNKYIKLSDTQKIEYINLLNTTSFKGVISDPFTDSNCMSHKNINDLECAFLNILTQ